MFEPSSWACFLAHTDHGVFDRGTEGERERNDRKARGSRTMESAKITWSWAHFSYSAVIGATLRSLNKGRASRGMYRFTPAFRKHPDEEP